jgi:hypothetical protein
MKGECRVKINVCSKSYVTQSLKNPNTYACQTFLMYCVSFPSLPSSPCKIKSIWLYANQLGLYISSADDPLFFFSTLLCYRWKNDQFRIQWVFLPWFFKSTPFFPIFIVFVWQAPGYSIFPIFFNNILCFFTIPVCHFYAITKILQYKYFIPINP